MGPAMGFLHQLHLLLWKNVTLKRRSPVSAGGRRGCCGWELPCSPGRRGGGRGETPAWGRLRGAAAWDGGSPGAAGGCGATPGPSSPCSPRRPGPEDARYVGMRTWRVRSRGAAGNEPWVPSVCEPTGCPGCRHVGPGVSPARRGSNSWVSPAPLPPVSVGGARALWQMEEPRAVGSVPPPTQPSGLGSISLPATARARVPNASGTCQPCPWSPGLLLRVGELSPGPRDLQAINRLPSDMWVRVASPPWAGQELLP